VQTLITHGAKPGALTVDKRNALHMAAESGASVATAVLLNPKESNGTQDRKVLEAQTERGETPLARAAAKGHGAV
ncbi:unnamed protein product, partial [Symbiodinium sp. CCMP2456]